MVDLQPHPSGVFLPVRVQPGGKANVLKGTQAGALKLSVTTAAEKGKANDAVIDLLCDTLDLKRSQIELISGATSRQKKFFVAAVTISELQERIERSLKDA